MYQERVINNLYDDKSAINLLESNDLSPPQNIDFSIGIYDKNEVLIGIGSRCGDILQGIAVHKDYIGQGLSATIVTKLIKNASINGISHLFMFTKPKMVKQFTSLGFRMIAEADPYAAFLEYGASDVKKHQNYLASLAAGKPSNAACLVMNCNPFTSGHRFIIEHASRNSDFVYIFVVEEDASIFPFEVRYDLVKKGTEDLKNIMVIPSGKYIISNMTFPSYFTHDENKAKAFAALDAEIFLNVIVPPMSIKKRFLGSEPFSVVTAKYNEELKKRLPAGGVKVEIIERYEKSGIPISASYIRKCIKEDNLDLIREYVPNSTFEYLRSDKSKDVIKKIRETN